MKEKLLVFRAAQCGREPKGGKRKRTTQQKITSFATMTKCNQSEQQADRCNGRAKFMESLEDWIGQIVPLSKDSITISTRPGTSSATYLYCKSFSVLFMSKTGWQVDTKDFSPIPMLPTRLGTCMPSKSQAFLLSTRPASKKGKREGRLTPVSLRFLQ